MSAGLPHRFSEAERAALYRAIVERRDVRRFIPGEIPDDVLHRLLLAAAHGPSVGYMQPWNFIVIRDKSVRQKIRDAFEDANREAVSLFHNERAEHYTQLKLEGILESSLNLCITCDRSRFGPVVLGRTAQPDMDIYSTVCAVQNLWLAARAEGVAMGWVSILKIEDIKEILHLPDSVIPVAYLCLGHTESFADEPELKTEGWLPELPIKELIFHDCWAKTSPGND